jgi:hypothetical protein
LSGPVALLKEQALLESAKSYLNFCRYHVVLGKAVLDSPKFKMGSVESRGQLCSGKKGKPQIFTEER